MHTDYKLEYFCSDGAAQIYNAVDDIWGVAQDEGDEDGVKYLNDLWHVQKNLKENWNRDPDLNMDLKNGLLSDVQNLAKLPEYEDFEFAVFLVLKKWRNFAPTFA